MRTGAGMNKHASPGTSGRHIAEELLWYDYIKFSDLLLTSYVDLLRVSDQRASVLGVHRMEYTAGSSIMIGVDHVVPSF